MQRMVVADPMGNLLGFFATVALMVALVYARPYAAEREMLQGRALHPQHVLAAGHRVMLVGATTSWWSISASN